MMQEHGSMQIGTELSNLIGPGKIRLSLKNRDTYPEIIIKFDEN